MTCCTALAPEPPEPMSHAEQEVDTILSYVEQRDALQLKLDNALARIRSLEYNLNVDVVDELNRLEQENAALRFASQAAASHRKALEQLIKDCLKQMKSDADEIVSILTESFPALQDDDYHMVIRDDWQHELLALQRRFVELTTQEG